MKFSLPHDPNPPESWGSRAQASEPFSGSFSAGPLFPNQASSLSPSAAALADEMMSALGRGSQRDRFYAEFIVESVARGLNEGKLSKTKDLERHWQEAISPKSEASTRELREFTAFLFTQPMPAAFTEALSAALQRSLEVCQAFPLTEKEMADPKVIYRVAMGLYQEAMAQAPWEAQSPENTLNIAAAKALAQHFELALAAARIVQDGAACHTVSPSGARMLPASFSKGEQLAQLVHSAQLSVVFRMTLFFFQEMGKREKGSAFITGGMAEGRDMLLSASLTLARSLYTLAPPAVQSEFIASMQRCSEVRIDPMMPGVATSIPSQQRLHLSNLLYNFAGVHRLWPSVLPFVAPDLRITPLADAICATRAGSIERPALKGWSILQPNAQITILERGQDRSRLLLDSAGAGTEISVAHLPPEGTKDTLPIRVLKLQGERALLSSCLSAFELEPQEAAATARIVPHVKQLFGMLGELWGQYPDFFGALGPSSECVFLVHAANVFFLQKAKEQDIYSRPLGLAALPASQAAQIATQVAGLIGGDWQVWQLAGAASEPQAAVQVPLDQDLRPRNLRTELNEHLRQHGSFTWPEFLKLLRTVYSVEITQGAGSHVLLRRLEDDQARAPGGGRPCVVSAHAGWEKLRDPMTLQALWQALCNLSIRPEDFIGLLQRQQLAPTPDGASVQSHS
jgi:hypothetical protein